MKERHRNKNTQAKIIMKSTSFESLQKKHRNLFWMGMLFPIYLIPYSAYNLYLFQNAWTILFFVGVVILTLFIIRGYLMPSNPMLITPKNDQYVLHFTPYKKSNLTEKEISSKEFVANKLIIKTSSTTYEISLGWMSYKDVQWFKENIF